MVASIDCEAYVTAPVKLEVVLITCRIYFGFNCHVCCAINNMQHLERNEKQTFSNSTFFAYKTNEEFFT